MRKNKVIAFLLAMLMLCSVLAGCGTETGSSTEADKAATNSVAATSVSTEKADTASATTEKAAGEEPAAAVKLENVVVGSTTRATGAFFSNVFGSNSTDMDVRNMVHGYNPVYWASQMEFAIDDSVVEEMTTAKTARGITYTVKIKEDLTWNDGTPIKAADYVFAYLLQASKQLAENGADTSAWQHVAGYDTYSVGREKNFRGIRLLDDYTYSLTVKSSFEPYLYELSYLSTYPYPISVIAPGCEVVDSEMGAKIVDAGTDAQTIFTAALLKDTVVNGYLSNPTLTSGPYKLVSYDAATGTVEFEKNEYYKGNVEGQKPAFEKVTLKLMSQSSMADEFKDGKVHIINKVAGAENIESLYTASDANGGSYMSYSRLGLAFLALATKQGPQQFVNVRQALAYAFDAQAMVDEYLGGNGSTVKGYYGLGQWQTQAIGGAFVPEGEDAATWGALNLDKLNDYAFDLEKAEKLLIKDGWTKNENGKNFDKENDTLRYKKVGNKLMPLSFTFMQTKDNAAAEYIAVKLGANLAKIGGELKVVEADFADVIAAYESSDAEKPYDIIFLANNFISTQDPYTGLDFGDKQLSSLAQRMHTTAPDKLLDYMQYWVRYQLRFNEVLPCIPLYSGLYYDFCCKDVIGYRIGSYASWATAILYAEPAV